MDDTIDTDIDCQSDSRTASTPTSRKHENKGIVNDLFPCHVEQNAPQLESTESAARVLRVQYSGLFVRLLDPFRVVWHLFSSSIQDEISSAMDLRSMAIPSAALI